MADPELAKQAFLTEEAERGAGAPGAEPPCLRLGDDNANCKDMVDDSCRSMSWEDFNLPAARIRNEARFQNVSFNQLPRADRLDGDDRNHELKSGDMAAAEAFNSDFSFKHLAPPPGPADSDTHTGGSDSAIDSDHTATFDSKSVDQQMRAIYGEDVLEKAIQKMMVVQVKAMENPHSNSKQQSLQVQLPVLPTMVEGDGFTTGRLGEISPGRSTRPAPAPAPAPRARSLSHSLSSGTPRWGTRGPGSAAPAPYASPPSPQWADRSVTDARTPQSPRSPHWGSMPHSPDALRWTAKSPEPLEFGPRSPGPNGSSISRPAAVSAGATRRKYVDRRRKASHPGRSPTPASAPGAKTPIDRVPPAAPSPVASDSLKKNGNKLGAAGAPPAAAPVAVRASLGSQLNIPLPPDPEADHQPLKGEAEFELKRVHRSRKDPDRCRPSEEPVPLGAAPCAASVGVNKVSSPTRSLEKKKLRKTSAPPSAVCGDPSSAYCHVSTKLDRALCKIDAGRRPHARAYKISSLYLRPLPAQEDGSSPGLALGTTWATIILQWQFTIFMASFASLHDVSASTSATAGPGRLKTNTFSKRCWWRCHLTRDHNASFQSSSSRLYVIHATQNHMWIHTMFMNTNSSSTSTLFTLLQTLPTSWALEHLS